MKRFSQLKRVYKVLISLILAVALLVSIPFIVKAASDGEIDIYKLIYELIVRVDDQEEKIRELEREIEELEAEIYQIKNPTPTPTPEIDPKYEEYVLDTYVYKYGDSFNDIAEYFYGSSGSEYIEAILEFNKETLQKYDSRPHHDLFLFIPTEEYVNQFRVIVYEEIIDTYTIQFGDSLADIAIKFYDSSTAQYQEAIIKTNIDKYPDFTKSYYVSGWELDIPRVGTGFDDS